MLGAHLTPQFAWPLPPHAPPPPQQPLPLAVVCLGDDATDEDAFAGLAAAAAEGAIAGAFTVLVAAPLVEPAAEESAPTADVRTTAAELWVRNPSEVLALLEDIERLLAAPTAATA